MDTRSLLAMQALMLDADDACYAFYRQSTDEIMLVPAGEPELDAEIRSRMEQGFRMVAAVALLKRDTPDGHARIQFAEASADVPDETLQKAKSAYRDTLLERGILRPKTEWPDA